MKTHKKRETPARRRPPWTGENPWKRRRADRLADLGGQYRSPPVETDRAVMLEEPIVEWAREAYTMTEADALECW